MSTIARRNVNWRLNEALVCRLGFHHRVLLKPEAIKALRKFIRFGDK